MLYTQTFQSLMLHWLFLTQLSLENLAITALFNCGVNSVTNIRAIYICQEIIVEKALQL